ncbi:UvrD-helicase domain-containing protein [Pseudopedobacter beijingensis]|uniref:DNA 3'-5' helicase n=1 Tax=Pseudopedobacter beijingensis TaxID=1207056 RepID=A0ABW4IB32_9SPHI
MQKPLKRLQASAGSGKTFSLAVHYLTLLFSNENKYREILAVTFTNKATEEMKTRILEVLKGLAVDSNAAAIESYRKLLLQEHTNLDRHSLAEKADRIYRRILHDYSRFSVNTIDGFVQKVIRGFAFELGLDASYTLEMNIDRVKENLVERLDKELDRKPELVQWIINLAKERIEDNKSWNYKAELLNLTGEIFKERFAVFEQALQQIGLENTDKIFLEYAQASKKDVVLFEQQIVSLAQKGLETITRFGLTPDHLKGKSRSPLLRLQKVAVKDFKDIEKLFVLIDAPEDWFQKNVSDESYPELNSVLKELEQYFYHSYPDYILHQQFNKNVYFLRLMVELVSLLKNYREESGNLLISDAQNLLTGITDDAGDNPSFIWEKIGNKYRNFLFDEFQDTSVSQWGSFRSLVQNAIAEPSGAWIDHLIVGDTKQSIYRWRNGDWNILHSGVKRDLGEHNVVDSNLEENYRSSKEIIQFNNHLYHRLPVLVQTKINTEVEETGDEQLKAWWMAQDYHQVINQIYSQAEQKLTSGTEEGGVVKIRKFTKKEEDERIFSDTVFREYALEYLVEEITNLRDEHAYSYKDISILVRSNREAVEVVEMLMHAQIPVVSGEALLVGNNTAIKLIVNTLCALVGYEENTSLYKANCIALYHKINGNPVHPDSYLGLRFKPFAQLSALLPAELCAHASLWIQLPLPELVEKIIRSYGLDQKTEYLPYLLSFRDIVGNATRLGEKGIHSFLNWWDEEGMSRTLPSPEEANAVQVITIHKSKGLAFRAVFVPFCELGLSGKTNSVFWVPSEETPYKQLGSIPLKYTRELAKSSVAKYYFEEELYSHMDSLNMIYVATTRAKDYLFLGIKGKEKEDTNAIGNLLGLIYKDDFDEEGLYALGNYIEKPSRKSEKNLIQLQSYPTSDRISEIYEAVEDRHANHLLNIEQSGRKGSIMHEILANVKEKSEIASYIDDLNIQGIITEDEKEGFLQETKEVLDHPELKYLLGKAIRTIEEKGIVDESGRQHRPDKVLIGENEVIILDYKFTNKEHETHIEQLLSYKSLLQTMGYQNVSAYLFYALTRKLKAI